MNPYIGFLIEILTTLTVNEGITVVAFYSSLIIMLFALLIKKDEANKYQASIMLQVSGVLLVTSVIFQTKNSAIHLVSVFIIATLITKLEFLENLAAIFMRASESVYGYKKFLLTRDQKKNELAENSEELEGECIVPAENNDAVSDEVRQSQIKMKIATYMQIEELSLNYIATILGQTIERSVVIEGVKGRIQLDGLICNGGFQGNDILIEVKYTSSIPHLKSTVITQLKHMYEKYRQVTNKSAEVMLIIVSDELSTKLEQVEEALFKKHNLLPFTYRVLSLKQIGFENK